MTGRRTRMAVIGAGPGGLSVAARLTRVGSDVTLLDRADGVGGNWRRGYDGLRLNTVRWLSHLPGLRLPARLGRWVERDAFVAYLERYAGHHGLRLQGGVTATRVERRGRGWRVETDAGSVDADGVVVATGAFDVPVLPEWPGRDGFQAELRHGATYRSPGPYAGRSVLVVGSGASGLEIAVLLADGGARRVWLSVRACQNLFPRQWRSLPLTPPPAAQRLPAPVLDALGATVLRLFGRDWPSPLPRARAGLGTALRRHGQEPTVADGVVEALREGRIQMVSEVTGFDGHHVVLGGGHRIRPDAVIAATGYTHGLDPLVGHLGVLRADGGPVRPGGGRIPGAPGLAFVGFAPAVTGRLLQLARQSRRAAATAVA